MSESGLYHKGPSDAEFKATMKRWDDESRAIREKEHEAEAKKEALEREARHKVEEAEREAKRLAAKEAEDAAVAAMTLEDCAKAIRRLQAEVAELRAANVGPSHKVSDGASFDHGQFLNGSMSGARAPLEAVPQRERSGWVG